MRPWILVALATLGAFVAWDFHAATTFIGDDYVFLAFARLVSNPLSAFVSDMHGGEYYRPVPMLLWWLLERASRGAEWPFALAGLVLHGAAAVLVWALARRVGFSRLASSIAGVLFFLAPAQREAAWWFSASTDLLATVAALGSVVLLLKDSRVNQVASPFLAAVAYFSKETALVLPILAAAALWAQPRPAGGPWLARVRSLGPHASLAALYLVARFIVLRGVGGTHDPQAPWWGRVLQIAAGMAHAVAGYSPLPETAACLAGGGVLVLASAWAARAGGRAWFPLLWVAVSLLPLPAAGWVVGARYFYLPAVGLMLLMAAAMEARGRAPAMAVVILLMAILGLASGQQRAAEVLRYREVVAAAREAVSSGLAAGHRVFLVRGGVKDLDLALKLAGTVPISPQALVIPDVPASFVCMPADLQAQAQLLLARPPLPPSGAYRFAGHTIVGLARREESPDLEQVVQRLPDLRVLALAPGRDGRPQWRDLTEATLDAP